MKRKALLITAILLLLLGAVGAWVATNTVSETRKIWQNDALAQEMMQGRLFAVQKFLAKQAPALPQQSWRRWQSAAKEAGNTAAPVLLWVKMSTAPAQKITTNCSTGWPQATMLCCPCRMRKAVLMPLLRLTQATKTA